MVIRRMDEGDAEPVIELMLGNYDGVLAEYHSPQVLARSRARVTPETLREWMGWKRVYVVEDKDGIVATGSLADFGSEGQPKLSISQLFVRSDLHGQGIGRRLATHLIETARSIGAEKLHVPSTRNAIGFYRRLGFQPDLERPDPADETTWMTMDVPLPPSRQSRRIP
jgi:ribosomal protein S18 acetylase RimI-like enzyme